MPFTRDEIARGTKKIEALSKEIADATLKHFKACLFQDLVDDSWKVQLQARISGLVFGEDGAEDKAARRSSSHGEGEGEGDGGASGKRILPEPEQYLRKVKKMLPGDVFGARYRFAPLGCKNVHLLYKKMRASQRYQCAPLGKCSWFATWLWHCRRLSTAALQRGARATYTSAGTWRRKDAGAETLADARHSLTKGT